MLTAFLSKNHFHKEYLIYPPPNFTEVGIICQYHFSHFKYSEGIIKNVIILAEVTQSVRVQVRLRPQAQGHFYHGKGPGR